MSGSPFRWDLARRSELGSLVDNEVELSKDSVATLRSYAARVVALSADSNLCFVGRSLDSIYDYLSGVYQDTELTERLIRLDISLRLQNLSTLEAKKSEKVDWLRGLATSIKLDPQALASNRRPTSFVDFVDSGTTFGEIYRFYVAWSKDATVDVRSLRRKLRFIGLVEKKKSSPNTWRWNQHSTWTHELKSASIKNIPVETYQLGYWGSQQPKASPSYRPDLWNQSSNSGPEHSAERIEGLRHAYAWFKAGSSKKERAEFVRELNRVSGNEPWLNTICSSIG